MLDSTERPPTIEERYQVAGNTVDDEGRGPGHLRLAAGLAARDEIGRVQYDDKPSVTLGHRFAILQQDWHGVAKPIRRVPKSIRQWIDELPLLKTGEREVKGQMIPVMTRDKNGARLAHHKERAEIDALYQQELLQLAQRLPARARVRQDLFALALRWSWEDANEKVSAILRYSLDDNCTTCHGTGEVMAGEKVRACHDCRGHKKGPVPCGNEGYRMLDFMSKCRSHWLGSLKRMSRAIHKGA